MTAREAERMAEQPARPGGEVDRLRRELVAARQRLEDEVNYYRAQVETTRKRVEAEHLRLQASEVARRRKLEDDVAALSSRLHDAQQHSDRLQRRYDELSEQYLQQEASSRDSAEAQVARYKASAEVAWRSAEEEVERMEREIAEAHNALEQERTRSREMEETLRSLQGMDGDGGEDRQAELMEEVGAMKQALNLSERARVQSRRRVVRLGEKLMEAQARLDELAQRVAAGGDGKASDSKKKPFAGAAGYGAGNPSEVDLAKANAVFKSVSSSVEDEFQGEPLPSSDLGLGSLETELADEFMLISSDESLDRAKVAKLREQVEQAELREGTERLGHRQAARERELMQPRASFNAGTPAGVRSARPAGAAKRDEPDTKRRSGGAGSAIVALLLVAIMAGAGGWFLGLF